MDQRVSLPDDVFLVDRPFFDQSPNPLPSRAHRRHGPAPLEPVTIDPARRSPDPGQANNVFGSAGTNGLQDGLRETSQSQWTGGAAGAPQRQLHVVSDEHERPDRHRPKRAGAGNDRRSGVPISNVLNTTEETLYDAAQDAGMAGTALVGDEQLSGRVAHAGNFPLDLLLEPHPPTAAAAVAAVPQSGARHKRRKIATSSNETRTLTLPKPHQPKNATRRPRIPPLLQGLHQPPPDARLFPPITASTSGLRGNLPEVDRLEVPSDAAQPPSLEGQDTPSKNARSPETGGERNAEDVDRTPTKEGEDAAKPKYKKRNRWTDQETEDLLKGVSRFGIGSWKRILECPDYHFNARAPVDLKDRFRSCCPDQYRKHRLPDDGSMRENAVSNVMHSGTQGIPSETTKATRRRRTVTAQKAAEDLARLGIQEPFAKSRRRERREFTSEEDEALLQGFFKHGSSWNKILKDPELAFKDKFPHRLPTDLRDRFRNRFPQKYAEAGYKVRFKDGSKLEEEGDNPESSHMGTERTSSDGIVSAADVRSGVPALALNNLQLSSNLEDAYKPHRSVPLEPLLPAFHEPFADRFTDGLPGADDLGDDDYGPVILSRDIFHWADQNPSNPSGSSNHFPPPPTTTTATGPATETIFPPLTSLNLLTPLDSLHINPQATLNRPTWSNFYSLPPPPPPPYYPTAPAPALNSKPPPTTLPSSRASVTPPKPQPGLGLSTTSASSLTGAAGAGGSNILPSLSSKLAPSAGGVSSRMSASTTTTTVVAPVTLPPLPPEMRLEAVVDEEGG